MWPGSKASAKGEQGRSTEVDAPRAGLNLRKTLSDGTLPTMDAASARSRSPKGEFRYIDSNWMLSGRLVWRIIFLLSENFFSSLVRSHTRRRQRRRTGRVGVAGARRSRCREGMMEWLEHTQRDPRSPGLRSTKEDLQQTAFGRARFRCETKDASRTENRRAR